MTNKEKLQSFIEQVETVHEFEYGDFKRKIGLYLNRLEEEIGNAPQVRPLLEEMKVVVVYRPSGDIDTTRMKTIQIAKKILPHLS